MRATVVQIAATFLLAAGVCAGEEVERVVAVVNDGIITHREVRELVAPVLKELQKKHRGEDFRRLARRQWQMALDRLIDRQLLIQEGRRVIARQEEERRLVEQNVDLMIKDLIDKAGSLLQLKRLLAKKGETLEQRKERTKERALIELMISRNVDVWVSVPPRDIREYYENHAEDYTQVKEVKTRHIFIPFSAYESRRKAREMIEMVAAKLKKGASFEALAKEYSYGAHAKEGGLWDFMRRPAFRELDDVIFNLKPGEVSGIVETSRGYHIVKAEAVKPARKIPFEEVQDEISNKLFSERRAKRYREYMRRLRQEAYIEYK